MAVQRIGKYQITAEIGSGGFGRVYSAQDPSVGRLVAIKVMNAPGDTDLVRRFRAEAMTVAMLAHKNIVTVHDYGEQDGAPYLVMEYLEGVNLQDLIKQGSLSLLEKVEIMIEVAEGLSAAHRQGITHRDVKPANIMRLADGTVKIMDFGIARIASESANRLTQTGFIVGTWSYMAPEQFTGTSDPQTDIFAYGVTFYELLTGRNPFAATDPAAVFSRITGSDPPPVSSVLPGCPEDLDRLVQKAIAKDRAQRYANLQDLIVDAKPILFDLRRAEAGNTLAQATQLLGSGQLDAAQAAVRKALEQDPTHSGARQLRNQIEKEVQRRDSAAKAGTLLEKAERELRERQFQEASATLAALRPFVPGDSPLHTRLMRADAQIEGARRVAKLLDNARDNLRRLDLTEAFKAVSEALAADPGNATGMDLLQEVRSGMTLREAKRRMQEELSRAEGLLLTGETEQALGLLQELERNNPASPEVSNLRQRAEAQWAEECRRVKLVQGVNDCKALIKNQRFEEAVSRANMLLADFPDNAELQNLLRHATGRLAALKRAEQIARLKTEAAAYVSRQEFDFAIKLLETGVAKLGDDGELTRLLQSAIAGKEALEREQAIGEALEEARRLRRQRKYDEAAGTLERAIQTLGDAPQFQELLREIASERREEALREIARRAKAALDQNNPDTAVTGLRACLKKHGEDPEIRRLLENAEAQIRDRERAARMKAILDPARQLASVRRWPEALAMLDDGLRQFPADATLQAERKQVAAAQEAEQRELERAQREQERQQLEQERQQREREQAQREQERLRREQELARQAQEKARREQEIAQAVNQVQSARDAQAATEILNAAFLKHGKADQLLQAQQKVAEKAAEQQRVSAIESACAEARALIKQNQFDDALRALDAAEIRFPGALPLAAVRAEAEQGRAGYRRRLEIEQGLTRASDLVQKGQLQAGLFLLDDLLKSHPGSRELKDAAARLRSRLEEEDRRREITNVTGSIQQAIANRDWDRALDQATGAFAKFQSEDVARLKRQAEEGKQRKEIEEAEAGIVRARDAGNLDLAAELATAARIRWAQERRFANLEDAVQQAQAEQLIASARSHADAGRFEEAEKLARQALKRRPNLPSANDLLANVAARREAKKLQAAQQAEIKAAAPAPAPAPAPAAGSRTKIIGIGVAAALLAVAGIGYMLMPHAKPQPAPKPQENVAVNPTPPPPSPNPAPSNPPETKPGPEPVTPPVAPASIAVSGLAHPQATVGQEYSETLRGIGASGITWSIEGPLPPGLRLDKRTGRISGKPTAQGNYSFVAVASAKNAAGRADVSIAVAEAAPKPAPEPPKPSPPALPQCKAFNLATWGDLKKGKFTWSGHLTNGQASINANSPQVRGDFPASGAPVHFTQVSGDPVTFASGPDRANCWTAPLVIKGSAPAVTVTIQWELYQPPQ